MQANITLKRTDSDDPHFKDLIRLLDKDLRAIYGELQSFYDQFNKTDMIRHVVLAYEAGNAIGCGSFKEIEEGIVEIKRMFVMSKQRNKGVGAGILSELEKWAAELKYKTSVLETGTDQPFAIALYEKMDYAITENYGEYVGVDTSICMRKELS